MHSPRPYGRFADEIELSDEDTRAIEAMARNLTNFKTLSNLEMLKRVRDLPSGRQAVAVDAGGTFRVLVFEQRQPTMKLTEGLAQSDIPMLFSGVVEDFMVKKEEEGGEEKLTLKLTRQCRKRLSGYEDGDRIKESVKLNRFVIEYHRDFEHFKPEITGIYKFTQFHRMRPTWYSGAMAEVAQVVAGYGRQRLDELPEDDIERARLTVPAKVKRKIEEELVNVRLPGYAGIPDEEGQYRYDFKFRRTHGVAFDDNDEPWLLEIKESGVFAMPLPLVPATTTKAFREYMEEVDDNEILVLLDRFGGMPSGEKFPESEQDFEAWRRAGVIIKVCDTADFYDYRPYYTLCGWSLNSKGTEGFNTCWDYASNGLIHSYAYKLKLTLGAAKNGGRIPLDWELATDDADRAEQMRQLDAYLSRLFSQLSGNDARDLAIKYKLRRHTVEEILAQQGQGVDYWDSLEMEPIANHSGSVRQTASGPVYWGLWMYPQSQGRFKFPTLSGEGCESFVFVSPDYRGPAVRCDTILFGCYVGDQLQVIKYFIDDREFYRREQGNFEEPMIVGRWQKTTTSGNSGLMGYFYTSAFDDRQEAPPVKTHTELIGKDLGYSNPAYRTPSLLFRVGSVSRSRHYQHFKTTETTEGFSLDVAVCVPVFSRDCILYAYKEGTTGRSVTEEVSRGAVGDSTSYQLWTHDNIFHYMGSTGNGNKGEPRPKEGEFVYVDTMNFNPGADPTGFATSGDWLGLGGSVIDVSGMLARYTSRDSPHNANGVVVGGEAPAGAPDSKHQTNYPGESSGRISVSLTVAGSKTFSQERPNQWYYDFSPVDAGGSPHYFYRDAVYNAIGDAEYASISEKDQHGRRVKWGNTGLADHKSAHHFIGVINE